MSPRASAARHASASTLGHLLATAGTPRIAKKAYKLLISGNVCSDNDIRGEAGRRCCAPGFVEPSTRKLRRA
jgi:hypothetical protein